MPYTLLAIFAHPDDEAFGCGGTLARYAAEGHDVYLICATRGEAGKITDPEIPPESDRAQLREAELRAACAALGIHPPIFLGFHDSGRHERTRRDDPNALLNVEDEVVEEAVLTHLGDVQPDVLLTFDPHGIYGHIDHIKIHRAATGAFWAAAKVSAKLPQRLYYTTLLREEMARMQKLRPASPLAQLDPGRYAVTEGSLAARLDVRPYRDQKEAAIRAHRSQVGPASSFAGGGAQQDEPWQRMLREEVFTLGGLRGSFPAPPVDDLFAGMA